MSQKKVVVVDHDTLTQAPIREAFKAKGYEVVVCDGGFDALDELLTDGADAVVASTSLSDVNGYQLCSFIKSNETTSALPFVIFKPEGTQVDTFWKSASMADRFLSAEDFKNDESLIVELVGDLIEESEDRGWTHDTAKKLITGGRSFESKNVLASYAALLDSLLIDRLITRISRTLTALIEPRKLFLDTFFESIAQVFKPDLMGIVIADTYSPWAGFQVEGIIKKESIANVIEKINKQLDVPKELTLDVRGELDDGKGKNLAELEILPVMGEKNGIAALVFGSYQKKAFDNNAKAFMAQLQVQMRPVTQLLLAKQEIEVLHSREAYRASIDSLTGLYNLEFLVGFLQQQLLFSFRQRLAVGLLIVDIDKLASVNEGFGYEVGDVVLTTIANRLLNTTRSSDLVARYGGDEFAVVLPNTDVNGALVLAEKVRAEVEAMDFLRGSEGNSPKVTVSIGCSDFNMEDLNPETILRDAKLALQKAKLEGRNKVESSRITT